MIIEAIVKIIYQKVRGINVDCPYCADNVSDFKDHLSWCEYFNQGLLVKLGLMRVEPQ